MRIHLIPCSDPYSRKHHKDTIEKLVPKNKIISFEKGNEIQKILKDENYACWGVTNAKNNSNLKKWEKMKTGDVCLMYRDKIFFSAGKIITRFKNKELSEDLWGLNKDGLPWENMFLIDEIKKISIPIHILNNLMNYSPNFILQGYSTYSESISEKILAEFDLLNWNTPFYTSNCETDEEKNLRIKEQLKSIHQTDSLNNYSKSRKEQALLREFHLKQNKTQCSLCHRILPNELIVAAHIWERSKIKNDEIRKDPNIAMPLCKLGCDDLFEKKYLIVDSEGMIQKNEERIESELENFVEQYKNKKCLHFNEKTKLYFKNK